MKRTKKLGVLILALLMVMSIFPITMFASADSSDAVVKMSIFSYTKYPFDTGHSWLYFENISDKAVVVGAYKLQPGQAVSVGTFKNTRSDGAGVYYNVEAYCVNHYGANGRVSISQTITESQLKTVSSKINSNNTWTLMHDCSWFAATVWNSVANQKVIVGNLPSTLKLNIKTKSGDMTNVAMFSPAADQVFKQVGNSIVVVSSGSLKKEL